MLALGKEQGWERSSPWLGTFPPPQEGSQGTGPSAEVAPWGLCGLGDPFQLLAVPGGVHKEQIGGVLSSASASLGVVPGISGGLGWVIPAQGRAEREGKGSGMSFGLGVLGQSPQEGVGPGFQGQLSRKRPVLDGCGGNWPLMRFKHPDSQHHTGDPIPTTRDVCASLWEPAGLETPKYLAVVR